MMKVVRPRMRRSIASWMRRSVWGVDVTRGFIKNEDCGVFEEGTGDGEELALSLAQVFSPVGEDSIVPLGEAQDEVVNLGDFGYFDHFLKRCSLVPQADVVLYGPREEQRFLEDCAYGASQDLEVFCADVDAVDKNLSGEGIVKAHDKEKQCRFPCTCRAHDGHGLPGMSDEGNSGKHRLTEVRMCPIIMREKRIWKT